MFIKPSDIYFPGIDLNDVLKITHSFNTYNELTSLAQLQISTILLTNKIFNPALSEDIPLNKLTVTSNSLSSRATESRLLEQLANHINYLSLASTDKQKMHIAIIYYKGFSLERQNHIVTTVTDGTLNPFLADSLATKEFVECQTCRTYLTRQPNVNVHMIHVKDTNNFIVLTNSLVDEDLQMYPLAAMDCLGYPVDHDLRSLLLTTTQEKINAYLPLKIQEFTKQYYKKLINNNLEIFKDMLVQCNRTERIVREIDSVKHDYGHLLNELNRTAQRIKELMKTKLYIESNPISLELIDYIKQYELNNLVLLRKITSQTMLFVIRQDLLYWLNEDFEILANNAKYNTLHRLTNDELNFLRAILIDRTYTLQLVTAVKIQIIDGLTASCSSTDCDNYADSYMHNPHLYHYNCWGDNKALLDNASNFNDTLGFWQILKTTLASINLADGSVFNRFIEDFTGTIHGSIYSNTTCRTKDNRILLLKDAFQEFVQQSANTTTETTEV